MSPAPGSVQIEGLVRCMMRERCECAGFRDDTPNEAVSSRLSVEPILVHAWHATQDQGRSAESRQWGNSPSRVFGASHRRPDRPGAAPSRSRHRGEEVELSSELWAILAHLSARAHSPIVPKCASCSGPDSACPRDSYRGREKFIRHRDSQTAVDESSV